MYVCIYTHIHTYRCCRRLIQESNVCMYVHTYIYIYAYIYIHLCTYIHTHIIHTHTYIQVLPPADSIIYIYMCIYNIYAHIPTHRRGVAPG